MFDPKSLLDQFLGGQGGPRGNQSGRGNQGNQGIGDFLRGAGGGAVAGSLAALLLGSKAGREIGGEALKLGGMAAVGALAYKAWRDWQAGNPPPAPQEAARQAATRMLPAPSGTPFNPSTESARQSLARSLLRAMIAATKADGHVDAQEQARIFAEMDRMALSSEDKAFVMDELRANLDVDAVARGATTPEQAAEIYAASLLAVTVDSAAERGYLAMLAARLGLDDALVAHLHGTVAAATGEKVPVAP
ncbi:tellurite resistance TerB family protein [Reyranella sp.]|uniref:tellurite resistance TerB family protein n=1 Tax=Reyranella sp. TaxID=1929291 RepID=UPI00378426D1